MLCWRVGACLHLPPVDSGAPTAATSRLRGQPVPVEEKQQMCCRKDSRVGVWWESRHILAVESGRLGCSDHWYKISDPVRSRYWTPQSLSFLHTSSVWVIAGKFARAFSIECTYTHVFMSLHTHVQTICSPVQSTCWMVGRSQLIHLKLSTSAALMLKMHLAMVIAAVWKPRDAFPSNKALFLWLPSGPRYLPWLGRVYFNINSKMWLRMLICRACVWTDSGFMQWHSITFPSERRELGVVRNDHLTNMETEAEKGDMLGPRTPPSDWWSQDNV